MVLSVELGVGLLRQEALKKEIPKKYASYPRNTAPPQNECMSNTKISHTECKRHTLRLALLVIFFREHPSWNHHRILCPKRAVILVYSMYLLVSAVRA